MQNMTVLMQQLSEPVQQRKHANVLDDSITAHATLQRNLYRSIVRQCESLLERPDQGNFDTAWQAEVIGELWLSRRL